MAAKEGTGSSSRNDSADQSMGAKLYLPDGSALPAGLSLFLLTLRAAIHDVCSALSSTLMEFQTQGEVVGVWEHGRPQKNLTNTTLPESLFQQL